MRVKNNEEIFGHMLQSQSYTLTQVKELLGLNQSELKSIMGKKILKHVRGIVYKKDLCDAMYAMSNYRIYLE